MKDPVILITDTGGGLPHDLKTRLSNNTFEVIDNSFKRSPLGLLRQTNPDLILLGITNSNFENDINLVRKIRKKDKRIPVICVVKHSSEDLAIAALRAGVDDFFKMPYSGQALLDSINEKLSRQPAQTKKYGC